MKHLLFWGIAFAAFHVSHSNTAEFCQLPSDEGVGSSFIFAFYYDANHDQCSPFIFKGQGGNANRFQNETECIRKCSANAENIYPMEASKNCRLKKAAGDCSAHILRYYYDRINERCKVFFWTGCHGNGNRFANYFTCNTTCAGIHSEGAEVEVTDNESDTPIAIIFGVLLAAIIVAVLIALIVLTVQSKKKSTKKKVTEKSKESQSDSPLQEQGIEMA